MHMLAKRVILLYFRNKTQVLFSLFAVFIMIALYVLFLGQNMEMVLLANLQMDATSGTGAAMSSLVLAGMIATTAITTSVSIMGRSVTDRLDAANDFYTSPVPRAKISFGYIVGSTVVSITMATSMMVLALVYIHFQGGILPNIVGMLKLVLTVVLSALSANALMFVIAVKIKDIHAYSGLASAISALIGFLLGVFVPMGQLPGFAQWFIRLFPLSHSASMFRQVLADDQLTRLFYHTPAQYLEGFRRHFGVVITYGNFEPGFWFSALVLMSSTVLFFALGLFIVTKRSALMAE